LDFPVTIIGVPIVRESDGLAMSRCGVAGAAGRHACLAQAHTHYATRLSVCVRHSSKQPTNHPCSRNARLAPEARSQALSISAALRWAQEAVAAGQVASAADVSAAVRQRIADAGGEVDYVEVRVCVLVLCACGVVACRQQHQPDVHRRVCAAHAARSCGTLTT
jgi:pantothenate synthetase